MKRFFFLISIILLVFLLSIVMKEDYIRKADFIGKENIKKSFFYLKKNYLTSKYSSCFINKREQNFDKQIIIAGHTYGSPDDENLSTYPKFLDHLAKTAKKKYDYLLLTGDVVKKPTKSNFLQVKKELSDFSDNLYVAPGNHDVGGLGSANTKDRNEFLSVFDKNFQKIIINDNLFFILDTTLDPGNVSHEQLNFLRNELSNEENIKNIFVITHHVIWQNYTEKKVMSNVTNDFFSMSNFDDVISLFTSLGGKINVFFIAGDIAVIKGRTVLFCEKKMNLYFIATGMGNKTLDNYLKILISSDGEILSIKPIFF